MTKNNTSKDSGRFDIVFEALESEIQTPNGKIIMETTEAMNISFVGDRDINTLRELSESISAPCCSGQTTTHTI